MPNHYVVIGHFLFCCGRNFYIYQSLFIIFNTLMGLIDYTMHTNGCIYVCSFPQIT
jgi:hypothetical protein